MDCDKFGGRAWGGKINKGVGHSGCEGGAA